MLGATKKPLQNNKSYYEKEIHQSKKEWIIES